MNIDMIVMFTLAALVTTVVVNSVNSIVNGTDAIIKTAMENVCIVSIVTAAMTNAVTIDAKGGGGTDFRPVFDLIDNPNSQLSTLNSQLSDPDEPPVCVVYLTDLDGSFPAKEPEYPVLWCVPPGVNANRKIPFGEIVAVK